MPWIVPVATAVIGAASSLYSSNKQRQQAGNLQKQQQPLIDAQTGLVKSLSPYATGFYQRAQDAYDPAAAHYRALASGDRSQIMQALSPQLATINNRYGSLIQASRELSPRSGPSASFNAELPFRAGDESQALINKEVSGSYGNLASLASEAGGLGAGAAGYASNSASGANNLLMSQYGVGRQSAADQAAAYQQFIQGLDTAWSTYKKGTTTTPSNDPARNPWDGG